MDDKEKIKFSDEEIEGIAKAIALADLAARSPKSNRAGGSCGSLSQREKSEHSDDKGRTFLQSDSQSKIRGCL